MDRRKLNTLLKYLKEYRKSLNDDDKQLVLASEELIESISNEKSSPVKDTEKPHIYDMLSLIDNREFDKLSSYNINIDIELILNKTKFIEELEEKNKLTKYTMNELKIIYYILTGEKNPHIMNARKKETLTNYVRELLFSYRRSKRLIHK